LLYEIWLLRTKGMDATRSVLAERLRVTPAVVDGIIHDLRSEISPRTYVISKPLKRASRNKKRKAKPVYRYVLSEKTFVTKPVTAALLLALRSYPRSGEKMVNRKEFVKEMARRLRRTEVELNRRVGRSIEKRYVKSVDRGGHFIVEAERTLFEEPYLRLLSQRRNLLGSV
jgi:hypothetical protein